MVLLLSVVNVLRSQTEMAQFFLASPPFDQYDFLQNMQNTKVVQKDCQVRELNKEDAMDCSRWKKQMKDDR